MEAMKRLPDASVALLLTDLPYGITMNPWDTPLDMPAFWTEAWRVCRPNAAVITTAMQVFAAKAIMSCEKYFRYKIVWVKPIVSGFLNAKVCPLRSHEDILVFYRKKPVYNPQMTKGKPAKTQKPTKLTSNYRAFERMAYDNPEGLRYPRDVVEFANPVRPCQHPTEKPVPLFEWLVRTYSNPGDLILDPCVGSGTTCLAALSCGRDSIGIDINIQMAKERVGEMQKLQSGSDEGCQEETIGV